MNTSNAKADTCLFVVSSEGMPVMVVPASNIPEAMSRARELLRDERCAAKGSIAENGVAVTFFVPAIFGDDKVLGFLPVEHGECVPGASATGMN